MSVLTITLSVVLFTIVVTGQLPHEPRDELTCILLRCRLRVNCRREPNHRCCRMCPQEKRCYHKGKWYDHNSKFKDECMNSCFCNNGNVGCTKRGCENGKGCFHNGKYYKNGESFKIDCNSCTCSSGKPVCTLIACPTPTCLYKGKIYESNKPMPSEKRCESCYCRKGKRQCAPTMCPMCKGPLRPGGCCRECTGFPLPN